MLTTLPIFNFGAGDNKKAGNQTLYNTLKGYQENGYEVLILSLFDIPHLDKPFPNVTIKRSVFYPLYENIIKIKKKVLKQKNLEDSKTVTTSIARKGSFYTLRFWQFFGFIEGTINNFIFKPDIFYGYEIYSTKPAKMLSSLFKKPLVTRFQGTELGFFLDDDEKFNEAKVYIEGTKVKSNLAIMANDGTDGDEVLEKLDFKPENTKFWVNGLNSKDSLINYKIDYDYREKMGLNKDTFIICTANRFVDWKRIDRILRVVDELNRKNIDVHLIAVGDGPEKNALLKMARELNLSNVTFTGTLDHSKTIYHIANSDLYITLNHSGNLGNSILESLALGIPVCTITNNSVNRVLKHNENAILFKNTSTQEIARIIIDVINNPALRTNLKLNAKSYARKNILSWEDRMVLEVKEISNL